MSWAPRQQRAFWRLTSTATPRSYDDAGRSDKYWVGRVSANATRYRITQKVAGVKGVVATVIEKQPGDLLMWITQGESPTVVRFEGPMVVGGPIWHVVPAGPLWKP